LADEKHERKPEHSGPFQLGRQFDEVGPEVGRLYESWHRPTGQPAVTLRPGDRMHWLHRGPWKVLLSCERDSPDVSLRIMQAPPFAPPAQVMDMLVLIKNAYEHVEDSPRLLSLFASGPRKALQRLRSRRVLAGLALLVGGVGLALSLLARAPGGEAPPWNTPVDAPVLIHSGHPIGYPLPSRPFRNQAKAPCKTQRQLEIELNGGCWVELAQKPPCAEDRAEHEGKCYLPVSKDRDTTPSALEP
jgi:hypothetical protein